MTSVRAMKQRLVCPVHGEALTTDRGLPPGDESVWTESALLCPRGCRYDILGGIPRFVEASSYASAFGLQWQRYRRTQLDSYTGVPISRNRLERCLGFPTAALAGKAVLEVGSGAGRFTELLLPACDLLVSMDMSVAVEANLENFRGGKPYLLLQADANASPLPRRAFDVVVCLGVLQHTPSPEETIRSLASHLKPGGLLVIDHYAPPRGASRFVNWISMATPLRAMLKRLSPANGLRATIWLTKLCDPIRRRTSKIRWLDRIAGRLFPTMCYYHLYPELAPAILYEWHELDTHDALTDHYKHLRNADQLRAALDALGLANIHAVYEGNGVEARATIPPIPFAV